MNERNKGHQEEKKKIEQKKLLTKMKQEIESLEFEIKANRKTKNIRNLKITGRALQLVAPYVITAGIVAGGFTILGDIPLYPNDEWKIYSKVMTELDNAGNIRKEKQYDDFMVNGNIIDNDNSMLYYYSKWEKGDDGFYSRTVQTYSIKKKSFEDIMELFKKEDLKLEDVLGKPSSNIKESKNNLTEDERQEESIIKAVIYNEDKNDYIIHKETVGENIALSVIYLIITIIAEFVVSSYRKKISSFNFSNCVDEIKRKHQPLDTNTIKKKLKLKRDNYNRMTR